MAIPMVPMETQLQSIFEEVVVSPSPERQRCGQARRMSGPLRAAVLPLRGWGHPGGDEKRVGEVLWVFMARSVPWSSAAVPAVCRAVPEGDSAGLQSAPAGLHRKTGAVGLRVKHLAWSILNYRAPSLL